MVKILPDLRERITGNNNTSPVEIAAKVVVSPFRNDNS